MKQYGLIGKTLSHSFSKSYFENKFNTEHIQNAYYSNFPLESIEEFKLLIKKDFQRPKCHYTLQIIHYSFFR